MRLAFTLVAFAAVLVAQTTDPTETPGPLYVASSVVNAANPRAGLAPNSIAVVSGVRLSYVTRIYSEADVRNGSMPVTLPNTGVKVSLKGLACGLFAVSPTEIRFLIPSIIPPGKHELRVALDGWYGPGVEVNITEAAPAIFQSDPEIVQAAREDWTPVTREMPARPGDSILFYATGLGMTRPVPGMLEIPTAPWELDRLPEFRVTLNGTDVPPENIVFAGLSEGYAGLYQVRIKLPDSIPTNPEIRIGFGELLSPAGVILPAGNP